MKKSVIQKGFDDGKLKKIFFEQFLFYLKIIYFLLKYSWFKILLKGIPWQSRVRTQHFHCQSLGSVAGWGTKILKAVWHSQKKKEPKNNFKTELKF